MRKPEETFGEQRENERSRDLWERLRSLLQGPGMAFSLPSSRHGTGVQAVVAGSPRVVRRPRACSGELGSMS